MLNIETNSLLVETKYTGRKSDEPILSISKSGVFLNAAFVRTFYPKKAEKDNTTLYVQLMKNENNYYLLVSETVYNNFYCATYNPDGKSYSIGAKGFREVLGKAGKTIRFLLEKEKTNYSNIIAFKLEPFVADKIQTQNLPADFLIG